MNTAGVCRKSLATAVFLVYRKCWTEKDRVGRAGWHMLVLTEHPPMDFHNDADISEDCLLWAVVGSYIQCSGISR